ncbi:MAG: hypothetical protein JRJ66_17135 [Deltaproteobacteria bacterium]|nr:hypothetical protein [Deltaproteobacteria bacterium]
MAQREALDVHEEQALVSQHEALLATPNPCIRVSEASACVVGVPAAPGGGPCRPCTRPG